MSSISFGRWLKKLRTEQDQTQEMLAEWVGCATPTLRSFELGKRRPSREMAERIADVLKVPTDQRGEFVRLARLPTEPSDESTNDAPLAPSVASQPTLLLATIPQPINPLIGREAELNALASLLLDEPGVHRARLVTLVGAGGMGKTRLALDLAMSLRDSFGDGAAFVSLAAIQQAQHLSLTLAEALGISLQGVKDVRQHLLAQLATRSMLLVLDNFEHLLAEAEAVTWVSDLLAGAPGVRLLVTSRERLRISGERTFELGGLALPTTGQSSTQPTDHADALLLFLDRAQHADSGFVLDASNRTEVVRICLLLGGMPLGIELAAAWVRTLTCAEIATEIARNIDFLELADRDASPRHRNMRAVFDHSWQLLSDAEQRLLMGLSYFRGGCTRASAEQVAGARLPTLASLIDKSLLTRDANGRFVLHELIRQFAAERLQLDQQQSAQIAAAHAHYFSDFLRHIQPRLQSDQQVQAIGEIAADLENLRLAWEWVCTHAALALVEPYHTILDYYFLVRGLNVESHKLVGRWFEINGDRGPASQRFFEQATEEGLASWALLYGARGYAAAHSLQPASALADHQQALALARRSENSRVLLYTTLWAGVCYCILGDLAQGIAYLEESVQHGREIGDPWFEALTTVGLGFTHSLCHEPAIAYKYLEKAYALLRMLGDPYLLAGCAAELSVAANALGITHDAKAIMEENLRTSRQRGERGTTAMLLFRLAQNNKSNGNLTEAEEQLREAIDLFAEGDQTWALPETLLTLAETLLAQGKIHQAEEYYHKTISTALAKQTPTYLMEAQLGLAALRLAEGKVGEAEKMLAQAETVPQPTAKQVARLQELHVQLIVLLSGS